MSLRSVWTVLGIGMAACGASTGNGGGAYIALDAHGDTGSVSDASTSDTGKSATSATDATTGDVAKTDSVASDATASPGSVGAACTGDGECTGFPGLSCFTKVDAVPAVGFPGMTWPGGYCSKACSDTDQDCGTGGSCAQSGSGGGQASYKMQYCAKSCQSDSACRVNDGYKCQIVLMGWGICVPGTP